MKTLIAGKRSTTVRVLGMATTLVASMASAGISLAADIHVLASGAPAEVAKVLAAKFAQDTGHQVVLTVATPGIIRQKLASDPADPASLCRSVLRPQNASVH